MRDEVHVNCFCWGVLNPGCRRVVAFGRPEKIFTPELLNETYQIHLMILKLGDRTVAIEDRDRDV